MYVSHIRIMGMVQSQMIDKFYRHPPLILYYCTFYIFLKKRQEEFTNSRDVIVNVLNCGLEVSEFKLNSNYFDHYMGNTFWERLGSLITESKVGDLCRG